MRRGDDKVIEHDDGCDNTRRHTWRCCCDDNECPRLRGGTTYTRKTWLTRQGARISEQSRADQSRPGGPKCRRLSRSNGTCVETTAKVCVLSAHLLSCFQISQAPVSRMRISGRFSSFNTARVLGTCLCQHHCFEEHELGLHWLCNTSLLSMSTYHLLVVTTSLQLNLCSIYGIAPRPSWSLDLSARAVAVFCLYICLLGIAQRRCRTEPYQGKRFECALDCRPIPGIWKMVTSERTRYLLKQSQNSVMSMHQCLLASLDRWHI